MQFELYGYGAGSTKDRNRAKQYRRLRARIDMRRALETDYSGANSFLTSLHLGAVTQKRSNEATDNRCVLSFSDCTPAEAIDVAFLFTRLAAHLLTDAPHTGSSAEISNTLRSRIGQISSLLSLVLAQRDGTVARPEEPVSSARCTLEEGN